MSLEPLHRRIRQELEANIRGGVWPVGTRVPTEAELEDQYGVSRTTAGRVLNDLANQGMIIRQRRRGSFVTQTALETNLLKFVNLFLHEPVSPGDHESIGCEVILARDSELTHPDLDADVALVRLERRKLTPSGTPAALELAVLPFRLIPDYADRPWETSSTSQALRGNGHVPGRIRLNVEACALDKRQAELLDLEPGDATLRCVRFTWLEDETLAEISQFILSPYENKLFLERSVDNSKDL